MFIKCEVKSQAEHLQLYNSTDSFAANMNQNHFILNYSIKVRK